MWWGRQRKRQDVPIGYMFIIMITVIAITWYVSYNSYAERYKDCKDEKRRLEDYFVYKQMRQEIRLSTCEVRLKRLIAYLKATH